MYCCVCIPSAFHFTYKTQLRITVPCPGAPSGSHNTESDMLVLQYVYYRSVQSSFILNQSHSWGVVRDSLINMKEAKTKKTSAASKISRAWCGPKPSLMARCSFLLHSRSLWASSSFACMLRPPTDGADPSTSAHHRSLNVVPKFKHVFHHAQNLLNLSPDTCRPSSPISPFFSCTKKSSHRFRHRTGCTAGLQMQW